MTTVSSWSIAKMPATTNGRGQVRLNYRLLYNARMPIVATVCLPAKTSRCNTDWTLLCHCVRLRLTKSVVWRYM